MLYLMSPMYNIYIYKFILYIHNIQIHVIPIGFTSPLTRIGPQRLRNSRLNAPGALKVAWEAAVLVGPGTTGGRGPWDADALAQKC